MNQQLRRNPVHAAVHRFRKHHVISRPQQPEHRVNPRHSRSEHVRGVPAFQFRYPFAPAPCGSDDSSARNRTRPFDLPHLVIHIRRSLINRQRPPRLSRGSGSWPTCIAFVANPISLLQSIFTRSSVAHHTYKTHTTPVKSPKQMCMASQIFQMNLRVAYPVRIGHRVNNFDSITMTPLRLSLTSTP